MQFYFIGGGISHKERRDRHLQKGGCERGRMRVREMKGNGKDFRQGKGRALRRGNLLFFLLKIPYAGHS